MATGHVWVSHIENNGMICFEICIKEAEVHLVVGGVLCKTKAWGEIIRIIRECFLIPTMGKLWRSSSTIQKKRKNINRKIRYTHITCTQVPRCTWKIWKPYYTFIYCIVIAHEAELPDSSDCCRAPVIRPTVFPLKRTLWGASGNHTLIKSRHLIDTLCKVLRR